MKKIFVAGGSGMLGTAFYEVFKNDYHLKITDKAVSYTHLTLPTKRIV